MELSEKHVSSQIVIADAGPLIHLDELCCSDLLSSFAKVLVPDAVWREVALHRPDMLPANRMILSHCIVPKRPDIIQAIIPLYTLHTGEAEALTLCLATPDSLLLTNDTAARLAANSLRITAHGTIGVIIRAIRTKQRTKTEVLSLLATIPTHSSLHIRPSLLEEVTKSVQESVP